MRVIKSKLKLLQQPIRRKENTLKSHSNLRVKTSKKPKARENADDQVMIGARFASDWFRAWRGLFGPIIGKSEAKPVHPDYFRHSRLLNIALTAY